MSEILRIVDTIHRDKRIDKDLIFHGMEQALQTAAKKKFGEEDDVQVTIDRETGDIYAYHGDERIEPEELGRIAALTAKQVMLQNFREAERDVVYDEYIDRVGDVVSATVRRYERGTVFANLGKAEGILPYREQIPGETYHVGERIKVVIIEVKKAGQKVKIILSRATPTLLEYLFDIEVPEIADNVIEIKGIAREAGHRTKIAVVSHDSRVDCVGACVGIRGSRIKTIVDELNGEKIDIVRWAPELEQYIKNALKPADINGIELDMENKKAMVFVDEDQLSLAIGRKGQNVRLASKLSGYELDIVGGTKEEYEDELLGYGGYVPPSVGTERSPDEITEEDVAVALGVHLSKSSNRRQARAAREERLKRKADQVFGKVQGEAGSKAPWLEEDDAAQDGGDEAGDDEAGDDDGPAKAPWLEDQAEKARADAGDADDGAEEDEAEEAEPPEAEAAETAETDEAGDDEDTEDTDDTEAEADEARATEEVAAEAEEEA